MLKSLHIENIAIIEKSDIDFSCGFNVLTGETGAGKSIIIDSIGLIIGSKSSKDLIGSYAEGSFVSALFSDFNPKQLEVLQSCDIKPDEEGNLLVSRKITKDGKSVVKINYAAATVGLLKEIAPVLVTIHGQHDGVKILDPSTHLDYLDEYSCNDNVLEQYRKKYLEVKSIREKLDSLYETQKRKESLTAVLRFKIDELENAKIKVGEYDELKKLRDNANNTQLLSQALGICESLFSSDENCVLDSISVILENLTNIQQIMPQVTVLLENLNKAKVELDEAALKVSDLFASIETCEYSPEYIESRLYTIENIVKKYQGEQPAVDALVSFKNELLELDDNDSIIAETASEYKVALTELEKLALNLSESRKKFAQKLSHEICIQLAQLDMPQVRFEVNITRKVNSRGGNKYTQNGFDLVEFLISSNAGFDPKPIAKIASGGELSRIMLCLKTIFNNENSEAGTVIYDEIDSGVSGSTAQKIGFKLKKSAENRQVFCITHLAQIAALADHHYLVEKNIESGVTRSNIRILSADQRKIEIARIMGGVNITDQLIRSADELINGGK